MRFLSASFCHWDFSPVSYEQCCYDELWRAYDILGHAQIVLSREDNDFNRADALGNLKRSVNQRLKTIEQHYNFKSKNAFGNNKKYLEFLEELGVVRPFLIKQLFELRNDVEHNDAKPVSNNRCKELLDIVWYFLKTTDRLLLSKQDSILYKSDCGKQFIEITPNQTNDWQLKFRAIISESLVLDVIADGFLEINLDNGGIKKIQRHEGCISLSGTFKTDKDLIEKVIMDLMIISDFGPDI